MAHDAIRALSGRVDCRHVSTVLHGPTMEDWVTVLAAAVERTYASPVILLSSTSVRWTNERRVVLSFEIELHGRTCVCFAWNEPTAHGHPCIVLRTPEFLTAEDAVRAIVPGCDTNVRTDLSGQSSAH